MRTSILRASSASPSGSQPSLLCLPAIHSSPLTSRTSLSPGQANRSPSLSPVTGGGSSMRPSLAFTEGGAAARQHNSSFGSFVGFRSSAISETLPDVSQVTAFAAAQQSGYTDKVCVFACMLGLLLAVLWCCCEVLFCCSCTASRS